ncbi:MAG TPA: hypothetical protein DCX34_18445 [Roseovarius sp.]|jgi:hypothetical protein|nr:hypothetical protein [Roseovarius sp.]|tara:strand:- start:389 stop:637 length:249 start_codon:yes stop_codon:yes gene_type:complete
MKKPRHPVTDHAVLRYLERAEGVDVEGIRRMIGRRVDRAVEMGACGIQADGLTFRLEQGVVVTVYETNRPERGRAVRRKVRP